MTIDGRVDIQNAPAIQQRTYVQWAGFWYLFALVTGVFGNFFVRYKHVDGVQTAENIVANEGLFRLGMAADLASFIGVIFLAFPFTRC